MPYKRPRSRYWQITVGVERVRQSAKTTDYAAAKALEDKLNHQAWLATQMGIKPPRCWEEAVVRYLNECKGHASYRARVATFRWWEGLLGKPDDIRTITRDLIEDKVSSHVTDTPSPQNATVNNKIGYLQHMLTKACEQWNWTDKKPQLRRYLGPPAKTKWLTVAQWRTLEAALPEDMRDYCTLALATGLRSAKIQTLTWQQYDAARRILTVTGLGTKRANPIPLNETAVAVLERRRHANPVHLTLVFPEFKTSQIISSRWKTWKKIRELPGLEGVTVHTLRYTHASWLGQAGVTKEVRKYLLGHAPADVHDVYTKWSDESLRPAVAVIDQLLSVSNEKAHGSTAASSN